MKLLLTMVAVQIMLRCVDGRLFLPHAVVHRDGNTALLWAARRGQESTVRLLLEFRADVNAADE